MHALQEAAQLHGRKAKLIEAASKEYAHGKQRTTAALLAIFLGVWGIHKFYLGERNACFVYILFSWTLIPWLIALFEAVNYLSMSPVTFNLMYNIDLVLKDIPPEPLAGPAHDEVFSMETTEDPEDFIDELSGVTSR
ncbi:MAG: TM2 domain-containing protein [Candidatus Melainabacteria bacterium]|nr:TM2 domain-containing protein [Candidatus Melainabacteria bacterium]